MQLAESGVDIWVWYGSDGVLPKLNGVASSMEPGEWGQRGFRSGVQGMNQMFTIFKVSSVSWESQAGRTHPYGMTKELLGLSC